MIKLRGVSVSKMTITLYIKFNWFPFSHNYSMSSGAHFLNPFSKVFQNNSTVTTDCLFIIGLIVKFSRVETDRALNC